MQEDRSNGHESREPDKAREAYEAPKLESLGTMVELTEGMGFLTLDLSGLRAASSDRALKENFEPVNPAAVLDAVRQLPIERWNYKTDDRSVRHIGPMAQDFGASFEVGEDDRVIMMVDANGVSLAAIQALATQLEQSAARIEALEAEVAELVSRAAAPA
jgi:hypothetical protein